MNAQEAPNRLRSFSAALKGLFLGSVLSFFALITLNLGGVQIGFFLLPVIVVYLWPSRASYSWSLICIYVLGLLTDIASDGPLGIWIISYLLVFVIMGKGLDPKTPFRVAIIGFLLCLVFVSITGYILGYISLGHAPQITSFFGSIGTALFLFPIIYWIRSFFVPRQIVTSIGRVF